MRRAREKAEAQAAAKRRYVDWAKVDRERLERERAEREKGERERRAGDATVKQSESDSPGPAARSFKEWSKAVDAPDPVEQTESDSPDWAKAVIGLFAMVMLAWGACNACVSCLSCPPADPNRVVVNCGSEFTAQQEARARVEALEERALGAVGLEVVEVAMALDEARERYAALYEAWERCEE